jgi:RHS repeat-associated protein
MNRNKLQLVALGFALFSGPLAAQTAEETVRYIHTDALGSVVAVSDEAGNIIERREYEPFGAQLTPTVQDGPGYTGHVQDSATGLTYMQQRYYDPQIGRFLSVDPVTAMDDPVAYFNRYKYANNNPYRFTDPDGRCWSCNFLPPPIEGRTNPHAPIPGANRGDAIVVGGLAATATLGATAAVAVSVGAPAMVMSAAEGASLQAGLVAQQGLNATSTAASVVGATVASSVEADIARGVYASGVANMDKITDAVSSYVVPGPPAMTPAGAAAGLTSAIVGEVTQAEPPKPPEPNRERK